MEGGVLMNMLAGIEAMAALDWLSAPRLQGRIYEWSWSGHPMWWMWGAGGS